MKIAQENDGSSYSQSFDDGWSRSAWRTVSDALGAATLVFSRAGYLLAAHVPASITTPELRNLAPGMHLQQFWSAALAQAIRAQLIRIDFFSEESSAKSSVEFDSYRLDLTCSRGAEGRAMFVVVQHKLMRPDTISHTDDSDFMLASLSRREHQILKLVAHGHSNKQMAMALQLRPKTIEKHRSSLMRKLHAQCIADLMRYWFRAHPEELNQVPNTAAPAQPQESFPRALANV
ncbi:MAG: helix-turn-helix transcriptional regulator [Planctomyces sp.]|nr:helix-turn-helix transcriptional regulator [Planctomyces sp.]